MKSYILSIGVIFFFLHTTIGQQLSRPDKVDSIVIDHMSMNHIPGLALAVIKNGQIEKKAFYGTSDIESDTYVDSNTLFEIASMSKQITCAGILLLQEDGLLSIEDELSQYLKGLPRAWKKMTIEQLMNHTSGLRDDWDEPTSYFLENNSDEKMSKAQQQYPLIFKPGRGFQYSSGPFFLGLVIREITGKHYSVLLKERVFDKLKMTNTSVYDSISLPENMARGYWWIEEKHIRGIDIPSTAESRADVGIITSLEDMIKWSLALDDNRLLNPQSLHLMFSAGKLKTGDSVPYSLGWYNYFFRNQLIFEHGGAFRTGFNSRITKLSDSKVEIIILSNKWKANLSDLTYKLASNYDSSFRKISETVQVTDSIKDRDSGVRKLMNKLALGKFDRGQLYRRVNVSGFDPDEIKELLRGFVEIKYVGKNTFHTRLLELYGARIHEALYFKVCADVISYWSVLRDDKGRVVALNMED